MSTSGEEFTGEENAVEALLGRATPRPAPPARDASIVRAAVHAEWRAVTRRYRARRQIAWLAIAASVVFAVAGAFNMFRIHGIAPVEVATISKEHGSIYLLGEQSELRELPDLTSISAGQTIVTGEDAGVGLRWGRGGGSLRIDANTRVEFLSPGSVRLLTGRIYFDSKGLAAIAGAGARAAEFVVETERGNVSHVGTQYMTALEDGTLTVSVREGEVRVDGRYAAVAGQQLRLSEMAPPSVTNVRQFGAAWQWIEDVAPRLDIDGRSTYDFLQWVGRETGLEVDFASPEAEKIAHSGELRGTIATPPRQALEIWMDGELLETEIAGGKIIVTASGSGSRQ